MWGKSKVNDFIWRSGEGVTSISPNDTVVGSKNGFGGMGGEVTLNVTYNINISDKREMERMIDANNKRLVDDVRRLVKIWL